MATSNLLQNASNASNSSEPDKQPGLTEDSSMKKDYNYITWKEYFMGIAILSSKRSKDGVTKVGACVVDEEKRIVGVGYNGMPLRCSDNLFPWGKKENLDNKNLYVCHAEMNAIVNKNPTSVNNCTLYTTLFPCNGCAKIVIQSGIKKVIYLSDEKKEKDSVKASRKMLNSADVELEPYHGSDSDQKKEICLQYSKQSG